MRKINYGLIVSDFDGTLVCDNGEILESTKKTIAQYRQDGGVFALSTGRLPAGIIPRAAELGLKGAVSCCQGSLIVDIESKKLLFQDFIPNKTAIQICKKLEQLGLHIHVYDVWDYYCNMDDEPLQFYQNVTRTKAKLVLDKPLSRFLEETGMDVCKFLAMVHPKDNAKVIAELEKQGFEGCVVTKSADVLVEVINARNSKGTAVEFLSKYYGVPLEKTVGVGDQWNDIPMIEKAGLGVAVKNADARLKESASVVLDYNNDEGAVGKLIEKYGYTEE